MQSPFIALEIHDVSLWEPSRVKPMLKVMKKWGYNALVLHQNDLLDCATQLGLTANYGVSDLRLKKVRNLTTWLNWLVDLLAEFDASLFLEIKEPSYHDYALAHYPALLGADGRPDPLHPDWQAFCRAKTDDLLDRVPGIGGLIITISSPESRVSLPDHLAETGADAGDWFDRMIAAFQQPLSAAGKALYIRDFSYTADMASDVLAAVNRCNGAVGASVKITAHDYFPEFPENPAASMVKAPLIFEFEAFGEHMGWGLIPNCRVAEYARRMGSYRKHNAQGVLMRISWEAITGLNALDSLSAANVYALPRLIAEPDADPQALLVDWLVDDYGFTPSELVETAARMMLESWQISAAAYWEGQVFPRHSCLPSTWQEGWLSMETSGMGRRDRDLAISPDDPRLTEAARLALYAAKDQAIAQALDLADRMLVLAPHLPDQLARQFQAFAWLPPFAEQFALATKATFHAARGQGDDLAAIAPLKAALLALADGLEARFAAAPDLPHQIRMLLAPAQIRLFCASLPVQADKQELPDNQQI